MESDENSDPDCTIIVATEYQSSSTNTLNFSFRSSELSKEVNEENLLLKYATTSSPADSCITSRLTSKSSKENNAELIETILIDSDDSNKNFGFSDDEDDLPAIILPLQATVSKINCNWTETVKEANTKGDSQGNSKSCESIVNGRLSNSSDDSDASKIPKKKSKTMLREEQRQQKLLEKAKKREEVALAKKIKKTLSENHKQSKAENCIKFITVVIDTELINDKCGDEILNTLQTAECKHEVTSQIVARTVTWKRKINNHFVDDNNKELVSAVDLVEEYDVLLILDWKQIVELIHFNSLLAHIKSIKSSLFNKRLTLVIFGLKNYFRYHESTKKNEERAKITQERQKSSKFDKTYKDVPKITQEQFEFALTELQLLCGCCYRTVESPQDVALLIMQFTKSVAQIPFKQEKYKKQEEEEWYMLGDKKDTVKVDKNGNGLSRLWRQQLTTFPSVSLEVAEAIAVQYPNPQSLISELNSCTKSEGEQLLQNIPIRRAAGPLSSARKIGPELSKKIYTFFAATEADAII